jgi:ankyrin repeat protein
MWTVDEGNAECVKLLLDHGAEVSNKDEYGELAMEIALARGHQNVLALLKKAGAK